MKLLFAMMKPSVVVPCGVIRGGLIAEFDRGGPSLGIGRRPARSSPCGSESWSWETRTAGRAERCS